MKKNIIRIIFFIIALGLFVTTIVLTNDTIKNKIETGKIVPVTIVMSMLLVSVILLLIKKNKL
jgi:hypothetical protein